MEDYMKRTLIIAAVVALATVGMSAVATAGAEKKCATCHNFDSSNKVGPGLGGVIGRAAGKHEGFKYGPGLKGADWTWDEAKLREWMCNSKDAVKKFTGDAKAKTKMPPQKVCDPAAQDEVLAKLKG